MTKSSKMNKVSRIFGGVLLIGAIVAVFFIRGNPPAAPEPPVRPVRTVTLENPQSTSQRSFPGRVQASRRVDLSFRISGPLIELPVRPGDTVAEGDVLARVDPRDYQIALADVQSALQEARANLQAMQAGARPEELRMLEEAVTSAESMFRTAKNQFERYEKLKADGTVSQREYDTARASFEVNDSKLRAARENLAKGKAGARSEDVEAQEAVIRGLEAREEDSRNRLEDCTMQAPFAGRVARRFVDNFQTISADQPIFSLQDAAMLEIVIRLPEGMVSEFKKKTVESIVAKFEAVPDRQFDLTVVEAETEADARTQTYAVTLSMEQPEGVAILAGMTADVYVRLSAAAGASREHWPLLADAIFSDETGAAFVWKVDAASLTVSSSRVEMGAVSGDTIFVVDGVAAGDIVVTAGVHSLSEGLKVRLLPDGGE